MAKQCRLHWALIGILEQGLSYRVCPQIRGENRQAAISGIPTSSLDHEDQVEMNHQVLINAAYCVTSRRPRDMQERRHRSPSLVETTSI